MDILVIILGIALIVGYIANLVKVIQDALGSKNENAFMVALRIIGIFVPVLGSVLGYLNGKSKSSLTTGSL